MAGQDNWLCDFSCWRFHLPRQGVKPIIFARPYLLSHVQLGAGSRGKQARLTLHAFHRCQPSNLPEWDRSAEKVGHQLKNRDQNVSRSLRSCVKLCHFKCTLFGCHFFCVNSAPRLYLHSIHKTVLAWPFWWRSLVLDKLETSMHCAQSLQAWLQKIQNA